MSIGRLGNAGLKYESDGKNPIKTARPAPALRTVAAGEPSLPKRARTLAFAGTAAVAPLKFPGFT